jgi:hypothetical protein
MSGMTGRVGSPGWGRYSRLDVGSAKSCLARACLDQDGMEAHGLLLKLVVLRLPLSCCFFHFLLGLGTGISFRLE